MTSKLSVVKVTDNRPGDGSLEIELSNGSTLMQGGGLTPDGANRVYMRYANGDTFELTPEVRLEVK